MAVAEEMIVSADFLQQARMTASELKIEIAVYLYEKKKLTMGQAKRLAGLGQIAFQHELAQRGVYIHYDEQDFEKDLHYLNLK